MLVCDGGVGAGGRRQLWRSALVAPTSTARPSPTAHAYLYVHVCEGVRGWASAYVCVRVCVCVGGPVVEMPR